MHQNHSVGDSPLADGDLGDPGEPAIVARNGVEGAARYGERMEERRPS